MTLATSMPSEIHTHVQAWFPLPLSAALVFVGLVYLRGWFHLRNISPNTISAWRVAAFLSALGFLWVAAGSPLSALDHELLTIHMINHLLLMTVVAPLLLAADPRRVLPCGLPERLDQVFHRSILRNAPAQSLGRVLSHPVFGWLFAAATVIGWHIPALFQLAVRSHWWHRLEYLSFIVAGVLFWRPISHPPFSIPRWSLPLYLFVATLPCDILSAFLVFCGRVVYPSYLSAPRLTGLSPFQDQQCAGALMWVWVTFACLVPAVILTVQMLAPQDIPLFFNPVALAANQPTAKADRTPSASGQPCSEVSCVLTGRRHPEPGGFF